MRTLKFVIAALVVLAAAVLLGIGYVWREIAFTEYKVSDTVSEMPTEHTTTTDSTKDVGSTAVREPEPSITIPEPITITPQSLPEGQRKLLKTLGLDDASFVITPEAIECAIGALGQERVLEIENGATPSIAEGLTLIACLK